MEQWPAEQEALAHVQYLQCDGTATEWYDNSPFSSCCSLTWPFSERLVLIQTSLSFSCKC